MEEPYNRSENIEKFAGYNIKLYVDDEVEGQFVNIA